MSKLTSVAFIMTRNALLASSVVAAAGGCTAGAYAGSPNVEGAVVAEDDSEVVYVETPPVVDIESYPVVVYGGVDVYYVEGRWYHRGPRGWAYYRQEPAELGRQEREVRLVEVIDGSPNSGEALPCRFARDESGLVPYPVVVVELSPAEFEQLEEGKLTLPKGWVREGREVLYASA